MNILAIDPGYEKVGYAVIRKEEKQGDNFTYITSDIIKTSASQPHQLRLKEVFDILDQIIKLYKIETLVIEQLFIFKNQKTVIKVAQAIGVIELLGANHNIIIARLTPLQIKQIITGYGNADKKSVLKMIQLTLANKIKIKDDDQADAIACGLAFCLNKQF